MTRTWADEGIFFMYVYWDFTVLPIHSLIVDGKCISYETTVT